MTRRALAEILLTLSRTTGWSRDELLGLPLSEATHYLALTAKAADR